MRELMCVVLNTPLGAWQNWTFWEQIKSSCTEFISKANPSDLLFGHLLEDILRDRGQAYRFGEDGVAQEV